VSAVAIYQYTGRRPVRLAPLWRAATRAAELCPDPGTALLVGAAWRGASLLWERQRDQTGHLAADG